MAIISDFMKALRQMLSVRFVWVLVKSILLTVCLLIAGSLLLAWAGGALLPGSVTLPLIGEITFLDEVISFAALPVLLILSSFVMFPVAALFVGFFLDEIASAVEKRHYPELPPARGIGVTGALIDAARFAVVFLFVNALAFVIYVLVPPLSPFIFWIVNGYLLGREYFTQVAMRRLPPHEAHELRKRYRLRVWFAGILMAIPLSVPLLGLIIPMLGVATFTHQFQRLGGPAAQGGT